MENTLWADDLYMSTPFLIRFYQLTGDEKQDVCAMNCLIEETILECPQQYLWSYKRYKCPRGVTREE